MLIRENIIRRGLIVHSNHVIGQINTKIYAEMAVISKYVHVIYIIACVYETLHCTALHCNFRLCSAQCTLYGQYTGNTQWKKEPQTVSTVQVYMRMINSFRCVVCFSSVKSDNFVLNSNKLFPSILSACIRWSR